MKIWILSSHTTKKTIDSTMLLMAAAKKMKISIQVYAPEDLHFEISPQVSSIYYQSKKLSPPDLVLPRLGWKTLKYGLRLCRFFEAIGVPVVNSTESLELASDKLSSLLVFQKNNLPIPKTRFAISSLDTQNHLLKGDKPQVFKLLYGSQGFGVTLHESRVQASAQADAYRTVPTDFLSQEFISESRGQDLRVFIINNKVVAAMKRQAPSDDFRSNLHQGGNAEPIKLLKAEECLALAAAKSLGLFYAGVDLLKSKKGPLLIEANPCPGFEGISEITSIPIAELLLTQLKKEHS